MSHVNSLLLLATACFTLMTAFCTLITAITAAVTKRTVREVHLQMNSRMDQLLEASNKLARAAGVLEGREQILSQEEKTPPV